MRHLIFPIIVLTIWNKYANAQRMTRYFVHLDSEGHITYSFTPGPSARSNLLLSSENFGPDADSDMTLPPDIETAEKTTLTPTTTTVTERLPHDEYPTVLETIAPQQPRRAFTVHYRVKYVTKQPRIEVSAVSSEGNSALKKEAPRLILTNATGEFLARKMKQFRSKEDLSSQIVPVEVSYQLVNGRKVFPEGYRPPNVFVRPIWKHPKLMTLPTLEPPQIREFPVPVKPRPQRVERPRFLVGHRADLKRILYKLRTRPLLSMTTTMEPIEIETTTATLATEAPITRLPFRFPPLIAERRGPYLIGFRVKRPRPQFEIPTTEATTTTTPEATTTATSSTEAAETPSTVTNWASRRISKSSSESASAEYRKENMSNAKSTSSEEEETKEDESVMEETTTTSVWSESSTTAAELETVTTTVKPMTDVVTDTTTIDTTTIEQVTTIEPTASSETTEAVTVTDIAETTTVTVTPAVSKPIEAVPAAEITQEEQDIIDLNEIQNVINTGFDTTNPNNEINNQVSEIWELKKKLEGENTQEMRTRILDAEQRLEDLFISLRKSRRRRMRAKMARS